MVPEINRASQKPCILRCGFLAKICVNPRKIHISLILWDPIQKPEVLFETPYDF
jgi:hypothetical protein